MKTKKTGLIIFLIAAVYMIGMAFVAGWGWVEPALRNLSPAQYSETIWTFDGGRSLQESLEKRLLR